MADDALAVCIVRLQPVQQRHVQALQEIAGRHAQCVLLCGGVTQAPSVINPWTFDERVAMLATALAPAAAPPVLPVADVWYDDLRWATAVRTAVAAHRAAHGITAAPIVLYALERADADFYARLFPDWTIGAVAAAPFDALLHERLLGTAPRTALAALPGPLQAPLAASLAQPLRRELREEFLFVQRYRDAWAGAPYTPIFVTVDALVTHGEHVLVIRRGRRPGCGLLALPGGFLDPEEFIRDGALRELREETGLALAHGDCREVRVFDHPLRSLRGRIITHLHRYELPVSTVAPAVTGGDDAEHASWLPFAAARPDLFFEDHYAMLQVALGLP